MNHEHESPNRRRRMVAALVAAITVAAATGGVIVARSGGGTLDAAAVSRDSGGGAHRNTLASFTTSRADGGAQFSARNVHGPAVVHIFASWCEVCRGEAPAFARLQRQYPGLNYYLLNVQDTPADAHAFMSRFGWSSESVLLSDPQRAAEGQLGLTGQPNTLFVDADGNVAQTIQGGVGAAALIDAAGRIA